jgi:hypothetical protein
MHPLTSAWCGYSPLATRPVAALDEQTLSLCDALLTAKLDFHFGNEVIIADCGRVDGACLHVGEHAYGRCCSGTSPTFAMRRRRYSRLSRKSGAS